MKEHLIGLAVGLVISALLVGGILGPWFTLYYMQKISSEIEKLRILLGGIMIYKLDEEKQADKEDRV